MTATKKDPVAALKASQAYQGGDPLGLQASGKARRRGAMRRAEMQRQHLSQLLAKKSITAEMYRAAAQLHEWALIARGGMQAMDWLREKVDGGKGGGADGFAGGVFDADRKLKAAFRESGISYNQMEIVLMVVCNEESLASVGAVIAARAGSPIEKAEPAVVRGYVGALLRDALAELHKFIFAPNRVDARCARVMMRAWLAEDAVPSDRPDLRGAATGRESAA